MRFRVVVFLLIVVFCFASSCRSTRQEVQNTDNKKEVVKENVVTYKDTVFVTEAAQTTLKIPTTQLSFKSDLNDDENLFKPKTYTQKNGNATARVRIKRDTIIVTAKCDTIAFKAKIKQQLKKEYVLEKEKVTTKIKRTKGVPVFKAIMYGLLAFILGFALGYIIKTFKIL